MKDLRHVGYDARIDWIKSNFPDVKVASADDSYIATVPSVFLLQYSWDEHFKNPEKRVFHLVPISTECKAEYRDEEASLFMLFNQAVAYDKKLYRYHPKTGQSSEVVKSGYYELIHKEDPRHKHESTDLMDLDQLIIADDLTVTTDFDLYHAHLYIPSYRAELS